MKRLFLFFSTALIAVCSFAQGQDVTSYIQNAGFDTDLTFKADGSMKLIVSDTTTLSSRSWGYIAADSTIYAKPKSMSGKSRPDGRTLEAVNGFWGQTTGWTFESNFNYPRCEWTYYGTIPYDLDSEAVPVADDGTSFLEVPARPTSFDGGEGFVYLRAGWGNKAVYKQEVTLPSAVYRLEYWTINVNPNASATASDLTQIQCQNEVFRDERGIGLNSQEWTKHEIEFTPTSTFVIQIGFQAATTGSAYNPIVCIDGVKLYKIGEAPSEESSHVSVPDIEVNVGESPEIIVNFSTTSTTLTGYQMSLYLPEGISLQKDEDDDFEYTLSSRHNKNHVFSVNEQADGGLLLVCYSPTKKTITTGDGELLRLPISVAATATGTLQAQLKTIKFSDTSSNVSQLDDVTFNIKTSKPVIDEAVTVAPIEAKAGESSEIVVSFSTTSTTLTGYQMSLYLPEGITLQKDEDDDYEYTLSSRHNKNHVFSVNEQADGGLLLVCYSPTKKTIASGDGELLRMPINVAATASGTLTAQLKTIKFSDTSSNVTQLSDVSFNISVQSAPQPQPQNLSLTALPAMTYGDAAYTLPAKTAEGLALTWTSSNTAVASISSGKVTIKGAGTAKIIATQAGNDSYLPFSREFTLTVAKATLTITADNKEKQQGEDNPVLTVSYAGFKYNDNASSLTKQPTVTTTATVNSPAGTYPITVSGAESNNYSISYVQGTLTVTAAPVNTTVLSPSDITGREDEEVELPITLDNAEFGENVVGVSFTLQLPQGVSLALDEDDDPVWSFVNERVNQKQFNVTPAQYADGTWGFRVYTTSASGVIKGTSGAFMTLTLKVAAGVEDGEYTIKLKDNKLSVKDATNNVSSVTLADATSTLTIENYVLGDVNDDGEIDLSDAIMVTYYSLHIVPSGFILKAADMNADGEVDLSDAIIIIYKSLGVIQSRSAEAHNSGRTYNDDMQLTATGSGYALSMANEGAYLGLQCDVRLPEGMMLDDVRLNDSRSNGHTVMWNQLEDGSYRIVAFSLSGKAFKGNVGELLSLETMGTTAGNVTVEHIFLVGCDLQKYVMSDLSTQTTGIYETEKGIGKSEESTYDLQGRKVTTPRKGLYLKGNNKYLVK